MLRFAEEWEGYQLYHLGLDPDIEWDPRIVDRLLEVGYGWGLFYAGKDWKDDRYDPRILDILLDVSESWHLYHVGLRWPDDRYDSRIAQALIDSKDMHYIRAALDKIDGMPPWPPERIKDIVMTWQGLGEDDA